ncbi:MAG: hypothetical protein IPJ93_01335 [Bacteroidota bacterium]|nr:MAG: hypothetical protein IPJ93_01335 [Bacteroidota bacterium]
MKTLLCFLLLPTILVAQTFQKNQSEGNEDFIKRIAPHSANEVKYLLSDSFNTSTEKIVYAYSIFEHGNLITNNDSTLTYFLCILVPTSVGALDYNMQQFRMVASYKRKQGLRVQRLLSRDGKRNFRYILQKWYDTGGVPRDVKRTFVYKQERKQNVY